MTKHTHGAVRAVKELAKLSDIHWWANKNDLNLFATIIDQETGLPELQARIDRLKAKLEAARAEAFAYGRCCDLYQDSLGQFHCHDCGQQTFAMLQAVQAILGDGTEVAMSHEESVRIALIRKTAPETIKHLEAEKAELVETLHGIKDMAKRYGTVCDDGNSTVGEYQFALRELSNMAQAVLAKEPESGETKQKGEPR